MCPRRLDIELNEDLLSRLDRASARTGRSRGKVVADALKEHLPSEPLASTSAIGQRLAILKSVMDRAEELNRRRSRDDIDAELAAIRSDRGNGR
jgi:metal-responsive CopG/Arc/MetJ family transcriptional regulator